MLRRFGDLKGMFLGAVDGEIGTVKDAYFDDHQWTMRYLVATTGPWLSGRGVLISPLSIRGINWDRGRLDLHLTRAQIENAPDIDADKPVSRQHEVAYFDYYRYPYYWAGPSWAGLGLGGAIARPAVETGGEELDRDQRGKGDPHLRSANEVDGYEIRATDGSIGSVTDFLFEDTDWALRYFIVDTRKWLPGRKVLISTDWIEQVSWDARAVDVAMSREAVRTSPEYDPQAVSAAEEQALYSHYGRTPRERTGVQIR